MYLLRPKATSSTKDDRGHIGIYQQGLWRGRGRAEWLQRLMRWIDRGTLNIMMLMGDLTRVRWSFSLAQYVSLAGDLPHCRYAIEPVRVGHLPP